MELHEVVAQAELFSQWNHTEKIKFFAWYLHHHAGVDYFAPADITKCFQVLHLAPPSSIHPLLKSLVDRKPKILLRGVKGYSLERVPRDQYTKKYSIRTATVHVDKLLSELPMKIPDIAEHAYFDEAMVCFRCGAFRAAIVMTWNLAYDHLCRWVLSGHLPDFNAQLPKSFPKADIQVVIKRDDFADLKESQVLQVCKSASIISGSLHKVLKEKLDRRNISAHPSGIAITQLTAEEFIRDLLENVVTKLV